MPEKKKKQEELDEVELHESGDVLKDMVANLNELPTDVLEQLLKNLNEIEEYNKKHPERRQKPKASTTSKAKGKK